MTLLTIWDGCASVYSVRLPSPDVLAGARDAFGAGHVHDVLYYLNMFTSANLPFIDCVMAALNGSA